MLGILRQLCPSVILEARNGLVSRTYSLPLVDGLWGIWGSCSNILKAIFYLPKGDYGSIAVYF